MSSGYSIADGHKFLTDNSSYIGTLTNLIQLSANSSLSSERIYLRKSLLIISCGGTYNYTMVIVKMLYCLLTLFREVFEKVRLTSKAIAYVSWKESSFFTDKKLIGFFFGLCHRFIFCTY